MRRRLISSTARGRATGTTPRTNDATGFVVRWLLTIPNFICLDVRTYFSLYSFACISGVEIYRSVSNTRPLVRTLKSARETTFSFLRQNDASGIAWREVFYILAFCWNEIWLFFKIDISRLSVQKRDNIHSVSGSLQMLAERHLQRRVESMPHDLLGSDYFEFATLLFESICRTCIYSSLTSPSPLHLRRSKELIARTATFTTSPLDCAERLL